MSERFVAAYGRQLVSRTTAEELGKLAHLVVDVKRHEVASLVVGTGRKASLVAWDQVSGFGPDAIMIADDNALHEPSDDFAKAAASGKLELVGKPALSDHGNLLGSVADVVFDPETGAIETIVIGEREEPVASLLGAGSFAVIVREPAEPAEPAEPEAAQPDTAA